MVSRNSSSESGDDGEGVLQIAVGKDADGEGAGEPDEIFAAGNAAEIAGELVHGVEGVAGAELQLEGLLLGLELLEIGDDLAMSVGSLPMMSLIVSERDSGPAPPPTGSSSRGEALRSFWLRTVLRISGSEVKPCRR